LKRHAQSFSVKTDLMRNRDQRARVGLPWGQRKAAPQLIDAYIQAQTRTHDHQRPKRAGSGYFGLLFFT
jgi:hypothetical protein